VLRQLPRGYTDDKQPIEVTCDDQGGQKYQLQYELPEQ